MDYFLFILNFAISVFGIYSLLRDSVEMRKRGLGAASGIFWWTLIICVWTLFALKIYLINK